MKSKYKLLLFFSLLAGLYLASCSKKMDVDFKDEYSRLVVEGGVTDEAKQHTIKLSKTNSFSDLDPQPLVSGAVVTISDGNSIETLTETTPGIYQTNPMYKGEIGNTYVLDINYKGEEYSAASTMTAKVVIDSMNLINNYNSFYSIKIYKSNSSDYAIAHYYVNGRFDGNMLKDNLAFISKDTNSFGNLIFFKVMCNIGDTVRLDVLSVSKDYCTYLSSLKEYLINNSGTSSNYSPFHGNVKNLTNPNKDVMGYFIASSVCSKSMICK